MKKLLSILLFALLFTASLSAQKTVTGTITDVSGIPLIGANVLVEGTTVGTITDIDGNFKLQVPSDITQLLVSYTGYTNQIADISNSNVVSIALAEGTMMDEIIVVGYGSQSRADISGAISTVEAEKIQGKAVAGIDGALQGTVSGLQLNSNNGQPGGGMSMRIRGNSSINAGNEPLYVIDGIPVTTGDFSENAYGGQDFNALVDINPNDIESIEVLKDAASASIYGSRGSNGVVLITTKKGFNGDAKIGFGVSRGSQEAINKWDMLSGEQYSELTGQDWNGLNADFFGELYQTAPISQYDLNVQGGDLKTKYYIGGSYFDQDGTIINQNFNRISGRMNFDHTANDWLTLNAGINISKSETRVVQSDNNIYGALSLAILQPQNVEIFNEDGSYNFAGMFFENPIATAAEKTNLLNSRRTLANVGIKARIIEGLSFNSKVGLDIIDFTERVYNPVTTSQGAGIDGEAFLNTSAAIRTVYQNYFDYQTGISNNVDLALLAGIDFENYDVSNTSLAGTGFPSAEFEYLASAAEYTNAAQDVTFNRLLSYYGRANFTVLNKIFVTGTLRADGSSKFGTNNRYGYFPSVSVGWDLSQENFLSSVSAVNQLKLRVSYGKTGNQFGIGNFAARGLSLGGNNYQGLPGVAPNSLANPDLKWEETTEFNVGLDFGIFDRVRGSIDFYNKDTDDLLLNRPLPPTSGFTGIDENIGSMNNTGVELGLNFDILRGDFNWGLGLLYAKNVNEVTALFEGQGFDRGFANRIDEGQPLSYFYGWKSLGVNPQTGDLDFEDINDDGVINGDDFQFIGSPLPDWIGSITSNMSFGGLYLDVFFNIVQGNDVLNYTRVFNEDGLRRGFNNNTRVLDAWKEAGDVTDVFRIGGDNASMNGNGSSSHWIEDGSFVRLKTVTLGYNVPDVITSKISMNGLRVYFTGENLALWTDYLGLDPEANFDGTSNLTLGTDFLTQGLNRTLKFGIQGSF